MKKTVITILLLAYSAVVLCCSSFVIQTDAGVYVGKNFDWMFGEGYLIQNNRGETRSALPIFEGIPVTWTSTFGSITFNQYGKNLPYGGMNEAGLVVEMLWLEETVYPFDPTQQYIGELEWIQYQLDNYATAKEVAQNAGKFSIRPVGGKIHYTIADQSGESVIVEFLNGKPVISPRTDNSTVCTNSAAYIAGIYYEKNKGTFRKGNHTLNRYLRLKDRTLAEESDETESFFDVLESAYQKKGSQPTQWQIVYDLSRQRIQFRTRDQKKIRSIAFSDFDFAAGQNPQYAELNARKWSLQPLTFAANQHLIDITMPKIGISKNLSDISRFIFEAQKPSRVALFHNHTSLVVSFDTKLENQYVLIATLRNQEEFSTRRSELVGTLLMYNGVKEFAFYNIPLAEYAIAAVVDKDHNQRPSIDEPIIFAEWNQADLPQQFSQVALLLHENYHIQGMRLE
ncbi:MAG: linear amide C-N hydrolase [Bacteroidia bacterium]